MMRACGLQLAETAADTPCRTGEVGSKMKKSIAAKGGSSQIKDTLRSISISDVERLVRGHTGARMTEADVRSSLDKLNLKNDKVKDRIMGTFQTRDGTIETHEFASGLAMLCGGGPVQDKLEFAFKMYDTNQDGGIQEGELKSFMKDFFSMSSKQTKSMLDSFCSMFPGDDAKFKDRVSTKLQKRTQDFIDRAVADALRHGDGRELTLQQFKKWCGQGDGMAKYLSDIGSKWFESIEDDFEPSGQDRDAFRSGGDSRDSRSRDARDSSRDARGGGGSSGDAAAFLKNAGSQRWKMAEADMQDLRSKFRSVGSRLSIAFRAYEDNRSGVISGSEFKRGLEELSVRLSPRETDDLIRHFDDGDGRVSFRLFLKEFESQLNIDTRDTGRQDENKVAGFFAKGNQRDSETVRIGSPSSRDDDRRGSAENFLSKGVQKSHRDDRRDGETRYLRRDDRRDGGGRDSAENFLSKGVRKESTAGGGGGGARDSAENFLSKGVRKSESPRLDRGGGGGGFGGGSRWQMEDSVIRELKRKISAHCHDRRTTVKDAFRHFDDDRSGHISQADFRRGLDDFGTMLRRDEIDDLMRHFDSNGDGRVYFLDFIREFDAHSGGGVGNSAEDFLEHGRRKSEVGGGGGHGSSYGNSSRSDLFLRRKLDGGWAKKFAMRHKKALKQRHGKSNDSKQWHKGKHTRFLRGMDVAKIKQLFANEARGNRMTYGDFKEVVKKLGVPNDRMARGLFEGFDQDRDQGLDIHEFLTGIQTLTTGNTKQKLEFAFQSFQGKHQKNYISREDLKRYLMSFVRIVRGTIGDITSDVASIFAISHTESTCQWCAESSRKSRGGFFSQTLAKSLDRTVEDMVNQAFRDARGGHDDRNSGLSLTEFTKWAERQPVLLSWYEDLGDKWLTSIHKNGGIEWHRKARQMGIRRAFQDVDLRSLLGDARRQGQGGKWFEIRRTDFRALLKSHTRLPSQDIIERLFEAFDMDQSDSLDMREFLSGMCVLCVGSRGDGTRALKEVLWEFSESSGIDREELAGCFRSFFVLANDVLNNTMLNCRQLFGNAEEHDFIDTIFAELNRDIEKFISTMVEQAFRSSGDSRSRTLSWSDFSRWNQSQSDLSEWMSRLADMWCEAIADDDSMFTTLYNDEDDHYDPRAPDYGSYYETYERDQPGKKKPNKYKPPYFLSGPVAPVSRFARAHAIVHRLIVRCLSCADLSSGTRWAGRNGLSVPGVPEKDLFHDADLPPNQPQEIHVSARPPDPRPPTPMRYFADGSGCAERRYRNPYAKRTCFSFHSSNPNIIE